MSAPHNASISASITCFLPTENDSTTLLLQATSDSQSSSQLVINPSDPHFNWDEASTIRDDSSEQGDGGSPNTPDNSRSASPLVSQEARLARIDNWLELARARHMQLPPVPQATSTRVTTDGAGPVQLAPLNPGLGSNFSLPVHPAMNFSSATDAAMLSRLDSHLLHRPVKAGVLKRKGKKAMTKPFWDTVMIKDETPRGGSYFDLILNPLPVQHRPSYFAIILN